MIAPPDPSAPTDRELGRFYTPEPVARLALALALDGRDPARVRLWDPTCGDGGFLRPAAALGVPRSHLVGHDVDGAALGALRGALPGADLCQADLFTLDPDGIGTFDVIAGNPPFVRGDHQSARQRAALRDAMSARLGLPLPTGVDLSLLALLQALRFLRPGGRLAFVLPNTWMDNARTAAVRAWLIERFALRLVVESRAEPWFEDAAVNTVIALWTRGAHGASTVFAQIDRADHRDASGLLDGPERPGLRRRCVPAARLAAPSWSPFLRAPAVWFDVLDAAGPALVPPAGTLELSYGTKPGASAFFCPRDPDELAGVEPECTRPFVRTLRGVSGYVVRAEEVEGRLFVAPPDPIPPGARAWIEAGAAQITASGAPLPHAPSLRANRPWYRLPDPRTGPVLFPQFRAARHHVIENPDGVYVNNSAWWGRWSDPALHPPGIALLNSSWLALAAEVLGRTNLGEGLLTLYGPEIAALPLPDPRRGRGDAPLLAAWSALRARSVLPFADEAERADRAALDDATLRVLGLDLALSAVIRAEAAQLMASRLALARARRSME